MMLKILLIVVWLVGFGIIFYLVRRVILRNFPEKYKELKKVYGKPLAEYGGLSGQAFRHGREGMQFKGLLKVSVFPQMLWVSACGRTILVPYDRHPISKTKWLFFTCLEIKDLPTLDASGAEIPLDKNGLPNGYMFRIQLPEKKADFILDQVRLFQMENAAQPREKIATK